MSYRLFTNEERTTLVTFWDSGIVEVAQRESAGHIWGPPTRLLEELNGRLVQPVAEEAGPLKEAREASESR